MEILVYFLVSGVMLLLTPANTQQLGNEQQLDIINFNQQSRSGALVPFTFPSQSTAPLASVAGPQIFHQPVAFPAVVGNNAQPENAAIASATPQEKMANATSHQIVQQTTFSIPKAMLSLTLDMGRCKSGIDTDCATNTVFSPFSISSTLTMLLMGQLLFKF